MRIGKNNIIAKSTLIPDFVEMGDHNRIGENVVIQATRGAKNPKLLIGDCNVINDNVKILVSDEGVIIKDWNVIHNNILIIGEGKLEIGHNCWFGQNTVLDGSGGLFIGNGVRVGMYSQIWTHVASGEQIEGCVLFGKRSTKILDDVWLVGSCVVGSGITLAKKTIYLINSVVTKDSEEGRVYSGAPAKLMERANFYKKVTLLEKFDMMYEWAMQFAQTHDRIKVTRPQAEEIIIEDHNLERIIFSNTSDQDLVFDSNTTLFNMKDKSFEKKKTNLEIVFYTFIYNNKARFTPINCEIL